jgi:hypothetical protein
MNCFNRTRLAIVVICIWIRNEKRGNCEVYWKSLQYELWRCPPSSQSFVIQNEMTVHKQLLSCKICNPTILYVGMYGWDFDKDYDNYYIVLYEFIIHIFKIYQSLSKTCYLQTTQVQRIYFVTWCRSCCMAYLIHADQIVTSAANLTFIRNNVSMGKNILTCCMLRMIMSLNCK